jgi:hypothetical protein
MMDTLVAGSQHAPRSQSFMRPRTGAESLSSKVSRDNLQEDLLVGYLHAEDERAMVSPLQVRRTLDRYLYVHLENNNKRDSDQVILRYTSRWPNPRLFVVDQLWLWILNDGKTWLIRTRRCQRILEH